MLKRSDILTQEFLPITIITTDEAVTNCRYYPAKGSKKGVIFVGGIEGGFDSPAKNLYPKLAAKLASEGISALRVQFRFPTLMEESVQDVLAGAKFLHSEGVEVLGLVGHSFGGAVVIQAGIALDWVKTVVTLAAQSFGAGTADKLAAHASILLIHGADDETLSPTNSQIIFDKAQGHKKLEILAGNRHGLDESSDGVFETIHAWLTGEL
jgi:pimeloyl-ACP methyl ester carboxylesterase